VSHDDTAAADPARPGRHHPPRRALVRLALSAAYCEVSNFAAGGVPTVSDDYGDPWDYVDHAVRLVAGDPTDVG
jgi:hypothetical protein